jgi:hypothetical protein
VGDREAHGSQIVGHLWHTLGQRYRKDRLARPVGTREDLERLLIAGVESGEPREMSEADWEALRHRALAGNELHSSELGPGVGVRGDQRLGGEIGATLGDLAGLPWAANAGVGQA